MVTVTGVPLSTGAATLRAAIFCVPYFLNGTFITAAPAISWLLALLIFGAGLSIIYLYCSTAGQVSRCMISR